MIAGRQRRAVVVDTRAELDGLSDAQIAAAADAAKSRKLEGKYVLITLQTPPASRRPRS